MTKLWNQFALQQKLLALIAVFLAGFLFFGSIAYQTLDKLRINGDLYRAISLRDELIADVASPSVSLLEPYITLHLLQDEQDPARVERLIDTLKRQEAEFESRYQHWQQPQVLEEGSLKSALVSSAVPAREFFRIANEQFVPAARQHDAAALARVVRSLRSSFDANQKLLADVQQIARQEDQSKEAGAARQLRSGIAALVVLGSMLFFGILLLGVLFARSITRPLAEVVDRAQQISQGDLTQPKLPAASEDETGRLARVFNTMTDNLAVMARQMREVTGSVNAAVAQILAATQQQAASTAEQSAAVHETTATMEEIAHSGAQIADRARQVAASAESTSTASQAGLGAVRGVRSSMGSIQEQAGAVAENIVDLSARTQAVGEIIASVNEIAEQSNLLALNAAIEAAAAGEHGRSFAVVASEMKNLAQQSKQATVQVRSILGEIQKGINTSVMLTEEAVKRVEAGRQQADVAERTIQEMAESIIQSIQAFQQIVAATNQQQIGFDQVTRAIQNIRDASEQTAIGTRQLEQAAGNLGDLGRKLQAVVEIYRV
jgi:methyl-accepting chemotaxis protein